jgi:type II secretory pathway pseudopilin PulG
MNSNLEPNEIVDTIHLLHKRINERFPKAGLVNVCMQLHYIAKESQLRCHWIKKPHLLLRVGVAVLIVLILFLVTFGIGLSVKFSSQDIEFTDFLQVLEAGMNTILLISAALFFLVTVETRRKRNRAMTAIHQLRALAHVIDMHQLTKDPERVFSKANRTASSPRQTMNAFELTRYLDYCTEMLSLVGKVAALYAQDFDDTVVLAAVNDVENLTTGLSRKIWQKIMIIYRFKHR